MSAVGGVQFSSWPKGTGRTRLLEQSDGFRGRADMDTKLRTVTRGGGGDGGGGGAAAVHWQGGGRLHEQGQPGALHGVEEKGVDRLVHGGGISGLNMDELMRERFRRMIMMTMKASWRRRAGAGTNSVNDQARTEPR